MPQPEASGTTVRDQPVERKSQEKQNSTCGKVGGDNGCERSASVHEALVTDLKDLRHLHGYLDVTAVCRSILRALRCERGRAK
jgi:hypothetical protein